MKIKSRIELALAVLAVVIVYWVLNILGIGCPIKYLTGISCAGCGMTRAWMSLLKLDFETAFYYHPLFFIPPFVILGIMLKNKIEKKMFNIGMWIVVVIFMVVYILRIFNVDDTIVEINLNNNAIWRLMKNIMER